MEITYTIYINALPDLVARAVREGQPIAAGMPGSELRASFEPGSGYAYVGRLPDGSEVKFVFGTVLGLDDDRQLQMTYRTRAHPAESRVTYQFEPIANRYTKLTVTQDQFADDDPNYELNKVGWPQLLSNLKSYVETGHVMHYHAAD